MASKIDTEKTAQPSHLTVHTMELSSQDGAALSPSTTCNSTDKTLKDISVELTRPTDISTPSSLHRLNPFDTDIETGQSSESLNRKSTQFTGRTLNNPNCSVWPGQDHWKQKAKLAKRKNRSCQCMAKLSKRNRLIAKILIAFLVIGIAVGVGVGISKPLGAGIWKAHES
ncbi:hypothetical protein BKA67DRAFT_378321 [Truncatella angustata]|uniref:Uncharacterized protein n=1 Tax=Truncatella angustata TaxID=152316 RepID=A0A9P8UFK4_9PEZI|nr:uncharacterized protein BKA67DRAFT_378321 [Truncatella angustata]KAH6648979.1 hypothetical protein BKA67DRAFT_378321 [Truncatella angustata]KAH8200751.1 hypothetical protein TruAng_005068 [Truncatella angustata]